MLLLNRVTNMQKISVTSKIMNLAVFDSSMPIIDLKKNNVPRTEPYGTP